MKKAPKSMLRAIDRTNELINLIDTGSKSITITSDYFASITYAAKKAAQKVGLKFSYGVLATGNNWERCVYLYFPGKSSEFYENGDRFDSFTLHQVAIVKIIRHKAQKKSEYQIKVIKTLDTEVNNIGPLVTAFFELSKKYAEDRGEQDKCDVTLSPTRLYDFLSHYNQWLMRLGIINKGISNYIYGWQTNGLPSPRFPSFPNEEEKYLSWFDVDSDYCQRGKEPVRLFNMLGIPGDEILFAATIYSLLKPLFRLCDIKVNTGFVLQLQVNTSAHSDEKDALVRNNNYQDALWLLELQTHMWCDYREWPTDQVFHKDDFKSNFRKRYHSRFLLNSLENHGFPVVLFGYIWPDGQGEAEIDEDAEDDDDNDDELASELSPIAGNRQLKAEELSYLCQGNCLPILVPLIPSKKDYPKEKCLTITLDLPNARSSLKHRDPDWEPVEREPIVNERNNVSQMEKIQKIHEKINRFYMQLMEGIDGYPVSIAKKILMKCLGKAFDVLGTTQKMATDQEEHQAVILSSLYFISDTLPDDDEEKTELSMYIHEFEQSIGVCSISYFANFIDEYLSKEVGKDHVIFYQDQKSIYLTYKKYWPAFIKYCERNGIKLTISAGAFRRNVLAKRGLITPQYKVSSNAAYPRYDYRKKVDGKEETVLNLSRKILEYI